MWKNPVWIMLKIHVNGDPYQFGYLKHLCCNLHESIFHITAPFCNSFACLYFSGSKWAFILPLSIRECGAANAHCVYTYRWFGLSEIWSHISKTKGTLHHHSWPWTCVRCPQKLVRYWHLLRSWARALWYYINININHDDLNDYKYILKPDMCKMTY